MIIVSMLIVKDAIGFLRLIIPLLLFLIERFHDLMYYDLINPLIHHL